jgi:hypothetical protein
MLAEPLFLEGVLQIPFRGDLPLMVAAGSLLIIAYLSLGALLQLLAGDLATGLGLAGLIASPAFGYAGVGFPTVGMNAFAQVWSAILPLRWYMAVLLGQAARGLPVSESAVPFAALAGWRCSLPASHCCAWRASSARAGLRRRDLPSNPRSSRPPRGIGGAFMAEWRRVLGTRSAFSVLFLAPLVYGIYYPQPYLNQILRKLPIAVVDNDLSDLSRRIVETLDASGALSVAVRARTLAEARTAIDRGKAFCRRRNPARHRARRAQGHHRSHPDLRGCHLPLHIQVDRKRGRHGHRSIDVRARFARRALGRKPRQGEIGELEPGRRSAAADLQPGGRLCELRRSGGVCADPAANPPDRRGDVDRHCAGERPAERLPACSAAASPI